MAARRRAPAKDTPSGGEGAAPPAGSDAAPGTSVGDLYERIRQRAYELWESEGRPQGRDREHWEQAERELGAEGSSSSSSPASSAPAAPAARGGRSRAAPATPSSSEGGGGTDAAADLGDGAPAAARGRRRPTTGGG